MRFNNRSIFITTLAAGVIACSGVANSAVAATAQYAGGETVNQHVNPEDVPSLDNGDSRRFDGHGLALQARHENPEDVPGLDAAGFHRPVGSRFARSARHVNPEDVPSAKASAPHRLTDKAFGSGNNDNPEDQS